MHETIYGLSSIFLLPTFIGQGESKVVLYVSTTTGDQAQHNDPLKVTALRFSSQIPSRSISHHACNYFSLNPIPTPLTSFQQPTAKAMPFTGLIFAHRKPGTTPAAFKSQYESRHVPLNQSLTGSHFPQSHKRYYVQRSENADGKNDYPARLPV